MNGAFPRKKYLAAAVALLAAGALAYGLLRPDVPKLAPQVLFTTLTGEIISTRDLRGKVVLVNFWATDCVPCRREMPQMIDTYNEYRPLGFETIAVAMSHDPPSHVLSYARGNNLPFKVALDPQGNVASRFGDVSFTPTSFLIDKRGTIIKRYVGAADFAELRALLEEALRQPSQG